MDSRMILVIIESPYAGDVDRNLEYLRAAMRDCLKRGEAPFASHALYTQPGVLDDGSRMVERDAEGTRRLHREKDAYPDSTTRRCLGLNREQRTADSKQPESFWLFWPSSCLLFSQDSHHESRSVS